MDFIIIRGNSLSSINAESNSAKAWIRVAMVIDANNPSCVHVQSDYVEDIVKQLQEEGWEVQVR